MRIPSQLLLASSALLLVSGCAISDGPTAFDPELMAAIGVEPFLADGTTKVKLFEHMAPSNEGDAIMDRALVALGTDTAGVTLVNAVLPNGFNYIDQASALEGWFALDTDGHSTRLERPLTSPPLHFGIEKLSDRRSTTGMDGSLVVQCDRVSTAFTLLDDTLTEAAVPPSACDGTSLTFGASFEQGVVARVRRDGQSLTFSSHAIADDTELRSVSAPAPDAGAVFVEETAEGEYLAVLASADELFSVRSDGTTERHPLELDGLVSVKRGFRNVAGGVSLSLSNADLLEWAVDDADAEPALVSRPAIPDDFTQGWTEVGTPGAAFAFRAEPNPRYEQARVPLAIQVSRYVDGVLEVDDAPTTPCLSRERCRAFGESYLLGVFDQGEIPQGLFAFWAWSNQVAFYLSPLDRGGGP